MPCRDNFEPLVYIHCDECHSEVAVSKKSYDSVFYCGPGCRTGGAFHIWPLVEEIRAERDLLRKQVEWLYQELAKARS